ncbi:hypothetical protein DXG03_003029 [Asterophora parasitica]|uniref:Protein kinase domain-containing protein n=1 Tax=Asterophora parasitica TaxID=117018 RepID=A0A9P7G1R5_9AGAR|nr:hypothetical protein DXG03_003029 [Asterophora parasitica]
MANTPPLIPKPPPELAPNDSSSSHLDLYFIGREEKVSQESDSDSDSSESGSDSSSDSGSVDSQATLDHAEGSLSFGHPLQRMFRVGSTDDDGPLFQGSLSRSSTSSFSSWSSSSSVTYDMYDSLYDFNHTQRAHTCYDSDYEELLEKVLKENPSFNSMSSDSMIFVEPSAPGLRDSLMIRCLPRTSSELYILLELNHKELRSDPWNPVPHLRCAVEREDAVYLFMERLNPYDQPPFKTVANYVDFVRQILEGLTFLHELKIANMTFQHAWCYMVDLSSAPSTCASPEDFDRATYPVRYYFTNLSHATKFETSNASAFKRDVQDCGVMIDSLLSYVCDIFLAPSTRADLAWHDQAPRVETKLKSLVKAMTFGGFGAEESRKLFEALVKSFESSTLETPTPMPQQPERSNTTPPIPTRSHPRELPPSISK